VAAGERMAREQPAAHFLYQEIDALSGVDKLKLRKKLHDGLVRPADVLRDLKVPTLWLTGDEDIVYPPFLSDILAKVMPNARVAQVRQAGHSVYFERPAEFNRIVDEFLGANR
jgi:pimeloyl-ACP methyl ester carboxylesterase